MTNNLRTVPSEGGKKIRITPAKSKELKRILDAIAEDIGKSRKEMLRQVASNVR
jgi:hypothetical protein